MKLHQVKYLRKLLQLASYLQLKELYRFVQPDTAQCKQADALKSQTFLAHLQATSIIFLHRYQHRQQELLLYYQVELQAYRNDRRHKKYFGHQAMYQQIQTPFCYNNLAHELNTDY